MHIGMLTACYAPVVNGVTRLVALYEKHLTAAGHQVTIFSLGEPAPGEDTGDVIRSPGLNLGQTGYHLALGYSLAAQRELQSVDILHCHHPLMALEFARRYGKGPVVFTNHTRYDLYLNSYGHVPHWLADQMMALAYRRLARLADAVIAPSTTVAGLMRAYGLGVPVEVIENGIEVERFQGAADEDLRAKLRIPEESIVFIYVGRVAPEKNVQRLMAEFRLAADQRDDIYLVCAGGGPLLKALATMVAENGLADRTRLVGPVDQDAVPAYLAMSNAFVSASVSEVHPLCVIEALATGLPVLAIDAPGMCDLVVNDVSGLLVAGMEGDLAVAMGGLAGDDALRSRLAQGARLAGRRYDIGVTVERTLSLYQRLLEEHQGQAVCLVRQRGKESDHG
jgi:1,2-diacylglycerol 3-alpha-glucosyltransferase